MLPRVQAAAVDAMLEQSALRGERVLAVLRALFCSVVLARFFWVSPWAPGRAWLTGAALAGALAFSGYVLVQARRGSRSLLFVSVTVDAAFCFLGLLPNILYRTSFPSILMMPDTAALVLITVATGFRHSAQAALLGSALNGASFVALVLIDRAVKGPQYATSLKSATVYAVVLLAAAAMAVVVAARARQLAQRGANHALAAEQAERGIETLLSEHHDLRSLLSSASINVELLERSLGEAAPGPDATRSAREVRADLSQINAQVSSMLARAFDEPDGPIEPTDVRPVLRVVAASAQNRFRDVGITVAVDVARPVVEVAGGARALASTLNNLVTNACEGDGKRGARSVVVRCIDDGGGAMSLQVIDDGPGFRESQLEAPAGCWPSSKRPETGHGLQLAERLAQRSNGSLLLRNGGEAGACVTLRLPRAR